MCSQAGLSQALWRVTEYQQLELGPESLSFPGTDCFPLSASSTTHLVIILPGLGTMLKPRVHTCIGWLCADICSSCWYCHWVGGHAHLDPGFGTLISTSDSASNPETHIGPTAFTFSGPHNSLLSGAALSVCWSAHPTQGWPQRGGQSTLSA